MTKAIVLRTCSVFFIISGLFLLLSFGTESQTAWIVGMTSGLTALVFAMLFAVTTEKKTPRRSTAAKLNFRPTGLRQAV